MRLQKTFRQLNVWLDKIIGLIFLAEGAEARLPESLIAPLRYDAARRNSMAAPVVRFRIDFAENSFVGPAKIGLLEAIRDSGSLAQAARNIGMSYRHAWLL